MVVKARVTEVVVVVGLERARAQERQMKEGRAVAIVAYGCGGVVVRGVVWYADRES